ncbi:MAG TPA: GNAT family N-acetyltransferase [Candidatus Nanopelagicales bacterium]|nr:GNAT family N-acetyltransferase [Candidatus Nanopelagicales bacterium]
MIEIDIAQHTEVLRALLDGSVKEERPRLFAVLGGRHRGRALVDAMPRPRWVVLREDLFGTSYLGGEIDRASLRAVITELCRRGRVLLDRGDPRVNLVAAEAGGEDARIGFTGRIEDERRLGQFARAVPEGVRVQRIDRSLLEQCLWRGLVYRVFEDANGYLSGSLGFCVGEEGKVFAEAHAVMWGNGEVEIGTITGEDHRGAGYATAACAALVLACQQRGFRTYWGCDLDNPASAAIARKLGYPGEHRYDLIRFEVLEETPEGPARS